MKRLTGKIERRVFRILRQTTGRSGNPAQIDRIAEQGVACIRKVNTDLMGASSGKTTFDQGHGSLIGFDQLKACQGNLAAIAYDRHAFTVSFVPADIAIELAFQRQEPPGEGQIGPVDIAGGEGFGQGIMNHGRLGHDHQAGRVLVQTMDDTGALLPADSFETFSTMAKEGVDQCACLVSGSGMRDKPGLLVEHDQVVVFIQDVQRDLLCDGAGREGFGKCQQQFHAVTQRFRRFADRLSVDGKAAAFNQGLDPGA